MEIEIGANLTHAIKWLGFFYMLARIFGERNLNIINGK